MRGILGREGMFQDDAESAVLNVMYDAIEQDLLKSCNLAVLQNSFDRRLRSGSLEIECEVTVNYDLSKEVMMDEANPYSFNRSILIGALPGRSGKIRYKVLMKRFESSATNDVIDAFADASGYRLGRFEHVVALSVEHPHIHDRHSVLAPASIKPEGTGESAILLSATEAGRSKFHFTFKEPSAGWPQPFLIMFVKKIGSVDES